MNQKIGKVQWQPSKRQNGSLRGTKEYWKDDLGFLLPSASCLQTGSVLPLLLIECRSYSRLDVVVLWNPMKRESNNTLEDASLSRFRQSKKNTWLCSHIRKVTSWYFWGHLLTFGHRKKCFIGLFMIVDGLNFVPLWFPSAMFSLRKLKCILKRQVAKTKADTSK